MTGPTGQAKADIDRMATRHYDELRRRSKTIARSKRSGATLHEELFSYLWGEVYSGRPSVAEAATDDNWFVGWCTKLMKTAVHGRNGGLFRWEKHHDVDFDVWSGESGDEDVLRRPWSPSSSRAMSPVDRTVVDPESTPDGRLVDWIGGTFYERELVERGHSDAQVERLVQLQACANRLPPHLFRLYRLYFVEGMSMRAISAAVGIPTKSVWAQVADLRDRLTSCLPTKQTPLL